MPEREFKGVLRCDRVLGGEQGTGFSALATVQKTAPHLKDLQGQRVYLRLDLVAGERPLASSQMEVQGILSVVPFHAKGLGFESYLSDAGVGFRLSRGRVLRVIGEPTLHRRFCAAGLAWFSSIVEEGLAERRPELARVLKAMLLGQQGALSQEQTERYRESGTMHLFAISGQHVMLIGLLIEGMLGLLGLRTWRQLVLSSLLLWLFVDITGASPSSLRALLMMLAFYLSRLGWFPMNPLAALAGAMLIECAFEPLVCFSAGFQLSYGIVALILLIALPLQDRLLELYNPHKTIPEAARSFWQRRVEQLRHWGLSAFALSYAASLISLPAGVLFFGLLSQGGILANVVMVPASSLVIFGGFLSLVFGFLQCGVLCVLLNLGSALVLLGMDSFLAWYVTFPWTHTACCFSNAWVGRLTMLVLLLGSLLAYHFKWGPKGWLFWAPGVFLGLVFLVFLNPALPLG